MVDFIHFCLNWLQNYVRNFCTINQQFQASIKEICKMSYKRFVMDSPYKANFILQNLFEWVNNYDLYCCSRFPYFETSALTGQNVTKAFDTLLGMVMLRIQKTVDGQNLPSRRRGAPNLELDANNAQPTKKPCEC